MDTEESNELQHRFENGLPQTDEGRYYHKAGWEGYKGAIKGTLGGLLIGGIVGALIGGAAALALAAFVPGITLAVAGGVALASAAWGMYEGQKKFSQVWMTTGVVAAAHEIQEHQTKEYIKGRFIELKRQIACMLGKEGAADAAPKTNNNPENYETLNGIPIPPSNGTDARVRRAGKGFIRDDDGQLIRLDDDEFPDYPTKHCDDHCQPQDRKLFYPSVGLIGAGIGAAAGGLFGVSGLAEHVLPEIIGGSAEALAHTAHAFTAASAVTGATIGASFGINRDMFRMVFDVTDRWFRGIVAHEAEPTIPTTNISPEIPQQAQEQAAPAKANCVSSPLHSCDERPLSERKKVSFQDQLVAKRALLELDPSQTVRQ